MPRIVYHPIVSEVHNKMDNMVFYRLRGKNYLRRLTKPTDPNTPAQQAVRSAFTTLAHLWKIFNGIHHKCWEEYAEGKGMSGFNAFISKNSDNQRDGDPLELFQSLNENHLLTFTAQTGTTAGSITCTFAPAPMTDGKTVTLFTQEITGPDGQGSEVMQIHPTPINTTSPVTINGLTPGGKYHVYAVVTDKAYEQATTVSQSVSSMATAGK